jgi:SAM-dependent methyltransferase
VDAHQDRPLSTLNAAHMFPNLKHSALYVAFKERRKAFQRRMRLPQYLGDDFCCPICATKLRAFKPIWKSFHRKMQEHGYVHPLSTVETFNFSAYSCPACDASDRERLYALYFDREFRTLDKSRRYRLVEFAPSIALQRKLRTYPFIDYRSADLFRQSVDDCIDITDMKPYADNSVDMFLCSHILEHVPDDRKALRELYRILKPGGFGIIMVPLIHGIEDTQESPDINSDTLRWKYYGDGDHKRQYGKRDFLNRLTAAGFRVDHLGIDDFGADAFRTAGIAPDSILYVVRKN